MGERQQEFSLVCRVHTRLCALPLQHVLETMRPLAVRPLAGAPAHVLGLTLIRGIAQPVIDLARLLGDESAQIARFVTLAVGERRAALAVGQVLGLHALPVARLQTLPPLLHHAGEDAVARIGELDSELMLILDSARLLPDADWLAAAIRGSEEPHT